MKTKFRAWDKKENRFIQHVNLNDDGSVSFLNSKALWQFDEDERLIIQFYTGLKDNTKTEEFPKGKEVFDGDILKVDGIVFEDKQPKKAVMSWDEYCHGWRMKIDAEKKVKERHIEIIGNILENKNLLES